MNKGIPIKLKTDKEQKMFFAEGPGGEILTISQMPGTNNPPTPQEFAQMRDRILKDNHHMKSPDSYTMVKEINSNEGVMLGLPELNGFDLAKHDMRQGVQVASANAIRDMS